MDTFPGPQHRQVDDAASGGPNRRTIVAGMAGLSAVTAVAGCSGGQSTSGSAGTAGSAAGGGASGAATGGSAGAGGAELAKTADVPVGGGLVLADSKLVLTQPTAGNIVALSAVCPHQGCVVNKIDGQRIICPCHRSEFNLDGTVAKGPAKTALPKVPVKVSGESVTKA